ncbi:putative TonB-dependent receptor [Cocos nucifera]|uniref:Putative TonB-dependent receptor n=1 Tax=Cocos nucifera TaxID=13894 RepID=A0A8K0N4A2_COCNU|nr:putative TonB-dependent receptor [Cocos nucifera]
MPTAASFLPRALFASRPRSPPLLASRPSRLPSSSSPLPRLGFFRPRRLLVLVAASAASFDELDAKRKSERRLSKKSILSNLIQEIEPLDVSLIQKDVPADTVDAMKRTISGMLGLLPSDQFHVLVEAFWDPLFKLLVSSMMTGYTLRNAEYRLCLERNLDIYDERAEKGKIEVVEVDRHEKIADRTTMMFNFSLENNLLPNLEKNEEQPKRQNMGVEGLGEMTPEAQEYILHLQSRLNSVKRELHDIKRKNSALQMQHFVGEEKNDLLDYLRSLQPEKVAELSEPTCPGVEETIHSVVHGLLATLSPKIHSMPSPQSDNAIGGTLNVGKDDCAELVENNSLQFQPLISVPRDYLARLLFWCMLLGHYLRGLEYRLELMQLFTISGDTESVSQNSDYVA